MRVTNIFLSLFLLAVLSLFFFYVPHPTGSVVDSSTTSAVIDTGIQVLYVTFDGTNTDLVSYTDEELESVVNLTLEKRSYGSIRWPQEVNLTEDVVDNILDLDTNITFSANFLEVDVAKISSLQGPAVITFYGLSFVNPRVIRNGVVCPESICTIISYQNGVLMFSTTQLSEFYAEETPAVATAAGAGGGGGRASGGGSGGAATPKATMVSPDIVKIYLVAGEAKTEYITFQNKEQKNKKITLMYEGLEQFISPRETSYVFTPGEIKDIPLILTARKEQEPGMYYGTIFLTEDGSVTPIRVVVEVQKRASPSLQIQVKEKRLLPGEVLVITTNKKQELFRYDITALDGKQVVQGELTTTGEGVAKITVPNKVMVGMYVVTMYSGEEFASDFFEVVLPALEKEPYVDYPMSYRAYWPFVLFCVLLTLLVVLLFLKKEDDDGKHLKEKP